MTYDYLAPYLAAIEDALREALTPPHGATAPLYQMMRYHMGWLNSRFEPEDAPRGKRLRPAMCLLACEAVGGDWRRALPAACSVELIHNFTLLHDDIEDASETRRHRPTAWALWGAPQALNAGDAMWAAARLAALRLSDQGYPAETVLRVARLLEETCLELCGGQYLDLAYEGVEGVSLAEYEQMINGKTAALLDASLAAGAILGGADEAAVAAYRALGRALGLTFQITDDILGVWGDPAVTGKSAASDILEKKKSLPIVYTWHWERERGLGDLAALFARPKLTPEDVPAALALLERARALAFARGHAQTHHQRMVACLDALPASSPAQAALRELALGIVDRAY